MNRTLMAVGELRSAWLDTVLHHDAVDVITAAPGWLPQRIGGHAVLARFPGRRIPASASHAWRGGVLSFLAEQVDALPQNEAWEQRIRACVERLRAGRVRVWHQGRHLDATRLLSTQDRTLLFFGPLDDGTLSDTRGLRFELTGTAHQQARGWMTQQLEEAEDISAEVAEVLEGSWAFEALGVEDMYYKVLYDYFGSTLAALDRETDDNPLLDSLTEFQQEAYHYAKGVLRRYGGVFLSDVVGLGKTWIALGLLRHLQDRYGHHAVVVAPPAVCPTWQDLALEHRISLATVSIGRLEDLDKFVDREVLVIDESHHFRNLGTRRYERVTGWLRPNREPSAKQVLLLSATPQNNDPADVLNQIKLFPDNYTRLPYRGESFDDLLRNLRSGDQDLRDLLQHVVVRRTRRFVKEAYPKATLPRRGSDGIIEQVPLKFPVRVSGSEQCLRYHLARGSDGESFYDQILRTLAGMEYPLHGLAQYVVPDRLSEPELAGLSRSGTALRGLYKSLLLKRLESSLHAFRVSMTRLVLRIQHALDELDRGIVTVKLSPGSDDTDERVEDGDGSKSVPATWFHSSRLRLALIRDRQRLAQLVKRVEELGSATDPKLRRLEAWLEARPPGVHRTIVFTQFADTAAWLYEALAQRFGRTAVVSGASAGKINIARRFAPKANRVDIPEDEQLDLLISTDALSEGVNLQDADTLINYDLHWNPVRLIQRAGRIDRIGSENDEIWIASFLPERKLEAGLRLEEVLRRRIQEFLRVFGEDSAVLPQDEVPDEAMMVSSFTGQALEESDTSDEMDGLSRHVNRILMLRKEQPDRFDIVAALRHARRAWSAAEKDGIAACRLGWFWTFWRARPGQDLVQIDDLAGLDALYAHATAGDGRPGAGAGQVAEAARELFEPLARQFEQQREHPALSAPEQFVLESLRAHRRTAPITQRGLLDNIEAWVRSGVAKAVVQSEGRRWKQKKLSPHAVFHEARVLCARYPGQVEELGEPELVGVVLSGD